MSITLQDVETILGLPIDGEVLVAPTGGGNWKTLCEELLGFAILANDKKTLVGKEFSSTALLSAL